MSEQIALSSSMAKLLDAMIVLATAYLKDNDSFDPFGAVVNDSGQTTFIDSLDVPTEQLRKGLVSRQLLRFLEDSIRAMASKMSVRVAALIRDVNLRPLEGGDSESALIANLEEARGDAVRVIIRYQREPGKVVLFDREIAEMPHVWLEG